MGTHESVLWVDEVRLDGHTDRGGPWVDGRRGGPYQFGLPVSHLRSCPLPALRMCRLRWRLGRPHPRRRNRPRLQVRHLRRRVRRLRWPLPRRRRRRPPFLCLCHCFRLPLHHYCLMRRASEINHVQGRREGAPPLERGAEPARVGEADNTTALARAIQAQNQQGGIEKIA